MNTKKIGLTGAAGYIGSRVMKLLKQQGHEVVAVDNFHRSQVREIEGQDVKEKDIRDREEIEEEFQDVELVMHLAALSGVDDCRENKDLAFETNIKGTENIAWLCRKKEIPLIFPMSMATIGDPQEFPITSDHPRNPMNTYGFTKTVNEKTIQQMAEGHFPAHVYMKTNLYGHHHINGTKVGKGTVINFFIDRALDGEPLTVYKPGSQERNFIHVKDVARAYINSLETIFDEEDGAKTIVLGSEESRSVEEVAHIVADKTEKIKGEKPEVKLVDNPRENETLVENFQVDTSEAKEEIGFETQLDLENQIEQMIKNTDQKVT